MHTVHVKVRARHDEEVHRLRPSTAQPARRQHPSAPRRDGSPAAPSQELRISHSSILQIVHVTTSHVTFWRVPAVSGRLAPPVYIVSLVEEHMFKVSSSGLIQSSQQSGGPFPVWMSVFGCPSPASSPCHHSKDRILPADSMSRPVRAMAARSVPRCAIRFSAASTLLCSAESGSRDRQYNCCQAELSGLRDSWAESCHAACRSPAKETVPSPDPAAGIRSPRGQ